MSTALDVFASLTDEDIAAATSEELAVLIAAMEASVAEVDAAWDLQDQQLVAEKLLQGLDPTQMHELLYGGAAGGGKTDFILWHLYHLAQQYPGFRGLVLRRTFRELARSIIKRSFETFDRSLCRWHGVDKVWRFANGSSIEFGYCEKETDVYQYDSAEYDVVAFDELTQWPSSAHYTYLFSRIRTRMSLARQGLVGHMIAGTNPGRVGGAWVKARFIDVAEPCERVLVRDDVTDVATTRVFVPAKLDDNRYINKRQYRASLANLDSKKRAQLEDGDWDAVEGQYFDEWNRALHVVPRFELPPYWRRIRAIDYGFANPMCCLWLAFDDDGTGYVYRELYGTRMTPKYQAATILELTPRREEIDYTIADPSIWAHTGIGDPIAQQYKGAGLPCRKASNARIDGWGRLRDFLRVDPDLGLPRLFIFSDCTNLIRTLPVLIHDDTNPEDLDTDGEDHAADALRYALMSRPRASRPPGGTPSSLEERHAQRRRQVRRARTGVAHHPELGAI